MLTPLGAMKLAVDEARKGFGFVAPNPAVGCVILDANGDLLAKGYHRVFGGDHAEIDALKQIQDENSLKGATVYVTLEPCAHEGKTPSCARRLATLPIKKVVYGRLDPNPLVCGKGVDILKQADIAVEQFDKLNGELEEIAEVFLWNQLHKSPFVALKVATSLDGQMAHGSGESKWITGDEARLYAHYLRAIYGTVLIGKGTFLRDDPSLDVRHQQFIGQKTKVILLDSRGETLAALAKSKIMRTHDPEDVYAAVGADTKADAYEFQILRCQTDKNGLIDLRSLLNEVYKNGISAMLVEGGAQVLSSFLQESLAQRFYQFIAPQIIGAKKGLSYTSQFSISALPDRRELRNPRTMNFGKDLLVTGRLD